MASNDELIRSACDQMPRVGDEGQRYEVRCKNEDGEDVGVGWTDKEDGGGLVESINMHPSWHDPYVIDRQSDG